MTDVIHLEEACEAILKVIIGKLKKGGIYHRVTYRIKSEKSLTEKFLSGDYSNEPGGKKVQDLVGIRINLFYFEDLEICKQILEDTYRLVCDNWVTNDMTENVFKAQKVNGVFVLPEKHLLEIDERTWEDPVDQTFEIQLRTILFEGWHEIEHDMRYKDFKNNRAHLWDGYESFSRLMNSMLANFELCDWSMLELYKELALKQIEDKNWRLAIRSHFRLKISDELLDERIVEVLDNDPEVARSIFGVQKPELVRMFLNEQRDILITADNIFRIIAENKDIKAIRNIYGNEKKNERVKERTKNEHKPLKSDYVFSLRTNIHVGDKHHVFRSSVNMVYDWAKDIVEEVFSDLPDKPDNMKKRMIGYSLDVDYSQERKFFEMDLQHISNTTIGEIWHVKATIYQREDKLNFYIDVICETSNEKTHTFAKPYVVTDIFKKYGFEDTGRVIDDSDINEYISFEELSELVNNQDRNMSVIISTCDELDNVYEGGLINIKKLKATVGSYCHVYKLSSEELAKLNDCYGIHEAMGAVFMWEIRALSPRIFNRESIMSSQFEENLYSDNESDRYERAFRHKLVLITKNVMKKPIF